MVNSNYHWKYYAPATNICSQAISKLPDSTIRIHAISDWLPCGLWLHISARFLLHTYIQKRRLISVICIAIKCRYATIRPRSMFAYGVYIDCLFVISVLAQPLQQYCRLKVQVLLMFSISFPTSF